MGRTDIAGRAKQGGIHLGKYVITSLLTYPLRWTLEAGLEKIKKSITDELPRGESEGVEVARQSGTESGGCGLSKSIQTHQPNLSRIV